MRPRTLWISILAAAAFCVVATYLAIEAKVLDSYHSAYLEVAQQELGDIAALVPNTLTLEQLSRAARQRGVAFRTLSASDYSQPPQGAHIVCIYGSLTFFFRADGQLQEMHGPLLERNPLFRWQ